jgi:4-hydroxy-3-methylbut-2-en-1-yl diphosphate synthase IspG/GcpE
MTSWDFTVILNGVEEMTDDLASALYEAGCDDGTVGSSCGVATVSFSRESDTLQNAIASAVADIRRAGCEVGRVQIEQEELAAWPTT